VSSTATTAPKLASQNVFSDETYEEADLLISKGKTDEETAAIQASYTDKENNYWYLFLKEDQDTVLTGVDEIAADGVTVNGNGTTIEISGYEGEISIYDMSGMRVYQGSDNEIEMDNPGIYMIVINGKCYKVAIK
jgi:hypothetical protein